MLTLLTPTGARPKAWEICEKLMQRQTYVGPVRWLVVDDGPEPQPVTFERNDWSVEIIRPEPLWRAPQNTQSRNLAAGLAFVSENDRVAVIEDDDYYAPDYLDTVCMWLDRGHDVVGESHARYYNVATGRGKAFDNTRHASLCSTAAQGEGVEALKTAVRTNQKFIDLELWRAPRLSKALYDAKRTVGIKGLPGRGGIGVGHSSRMGAPVSLVDWIGDDARLYQ